MSSIRHHFPGFRDTAPCCGDAGILNGGNFSRLLKGINQDSGNFERERAFTVQHLLTILREDDHSIVIGEHDPTIEDDAGIKPPGFVAQATNGDPEFTHAWYNKGMWLMKSRYA